MTTLTGALQPFETIVVVGAGGVGKTTTAAAIGALLASSRRTCVLTVDPARRLADALGLVGVGNDPVTVEVGSARFDVVMLDAQATFEAMVRRGANSPEQVAEVLSSPVYASLVSRLSGTQEYMAFERLWELRATGRYDVIVVDTPPAQWAIDFLHAPSRLARFLDNRVFRLLLRQPPLLLRPLALATRSLVRQIASVVGAQVVDDTIAFFQAFGGLEGAFRERATQTEELLASARTGYLLVTTIHEDAMAVAGRLRTALGELERDVRAVVVNRLPPDLGSLPSDPDAPPDLRRAAMGLLDARRGGLGRVRETLGPVDLLAVDDLAEPIASVEALGRLGARLGERELESASPEH
ncbi:Anion-transporting ATPase [Acidimicrobium ferrooxidans DSM 10331]|uniref:Anion-transporting ATPase n=1 Tax=Acidimicrobium ferrooxidans (strain DSM 10331 / JCM 15462 / NBRC 103882 / ICP) TaxID=525909 RepID=C7M2G2_ACIFD|nr:ArsA-related P-loop ATPase [Acidimicrobium ferrooxidans]ACU53206.1 Anion-transporting ATPase [Acidimicrobium ferrooxidans DSM 10331]